MLGHEDEGPDREVQRHPRGLDGPQRVVGLEHGQTRVPHELHDAPSASADLGRTAPIPCVDAFGDIEGGEGVHPAGVAREVDDEEDELSLDECRHDVCPFGVVD